jgi:Xaa-Pro aminopeptidase
MSLIRNLLYQIPRKRALSPADSEGMARSQALAYACAKDIARELKEGWTEAQTARLMEAYLGDHGVTTYFHKPFAWFGERSRFDGVERLRDFLPTERHLKGGECVILDMAPVYQGYPADIGYSCSLGENKDLENGRELLVKLRGLILQLFSRGLSPSGLTGGDICEAVVRHIQHAGYDAVHHRYPGAVLGHRLHAMSEAWRPPTFIPFGFGVFTRFLFEGVYPDLLNEEHRGDLLGAWAIEPHLGGRGFGCKFEEVVIVEPSGARWLSPEVPW